MTYPTGTKVRILSFVGPTFERDWSETGRILRWTAKMGPRSSLPKGYHPVKFDVDGATLMVHADRLMAANS